MQCELKQTEKARTTASFIPDTDILSGENGWKVYLDMPGIEESSLKIQLEKKQLKIHASTKKRETVEGTKVLYSEYYLGDYERIIQLSEEVDTENIEAELKYGVLTLSLPKKKPVSAKRISVNIA